MTKNEALLHYLNACNAARVKRICGIISWREYLDLCKSAHAAYQQAPA